MTITFGVGNLSRWPDSEKRRAEPIFVAGRLFLDQTGALLYDLHSDEFVPIRDDLAYSTLRDFFLPTGEYLGGALLQPFRRKDDAGVSLFDIYWIQFFEENASGTTDWGEMVNIRPVPPEHEVGRRR